MTKIAASGDPRRTMTLLWRSPTAADQGRPGPKASLSVDAIVDTAIALADDASDGSVSLRAVPAGWAVRRWPSTRMSRTGASCST